MTTNVAMRSLNLPSRTGLVVAVVGSAVMLTHCGSRSELEPSDIGSSAGGSTGGSMGGSTGGSMGGSPESTLPREPRVCIFDYDLTLSSHACPETTDQAAYFCRENTCITYDWYSQCLAKDARAAIAECVRRHAYIGIASKADVDACWTDKVTPITEQQQFPELTDSPDYATPQQAFSYPRLDDRATWNCEDCAYTMDGALSKPDGIRRVMRHYGLDPNLPTDRARVIFWDDTPSNISDVQTAMPEVRAITVPRFSDNADDGGCGITQQEIAAGWAP
jgi:hypothetical protein